MTDRDLIDILEEIKETPKRKSSLGGVVDDIEEMVTDVVDRVGNLVTKGKFARSPRPQKKP